MKLHVTQVMLTPSISIKTWILVPALAGSNPISKSTNGSVVPSTVLVRTMKNRDKEIANAFSCDPFVT